MFPLKYNTASQELPLGKFVDSTDGDTAETGLTIANTDIKLHKSGATTLANKNSGGATHISGGDYYCVLDATDTNTYGPMKVTVHVAGALYVQVWCLVMEANAYDALMAALGTGYLEADARLISGDSAAADNAESFFDGTGYAGTNNVMPTVTTLTNKTGFSLAATGLDAISQAATGMVEIAKAVWDRVLSGATHNIASSAGRRLRQSTGIVYTDGTAQAGGNNTITLAAGESSTDDIYEQSYVAIVGGTGAGQGHHVVSYNGTTKVVVIDDNWVVNPDATSEYVIFGAGSHDELSSGLAQAGAASTITLKSTSSATDDLYNNLFACVVSGTGRGQVRRISDYNGTTKVATVSQSWTTNPDATSGYMLIMNSNTTVDELASTVTSAQLVDDIMDEVCTGATHNVADSFARRLRNLQEFGTYEDDRVWIDTINGTAGTTDYESGTILNKVDTVADSNTVGTSLGLSGRGVAPGSSITFIASQDGQDWKGNIWTLALGGQSISDTHIQGATVSGICSGASAPEFHECYVGTVTIPPAHFKECDFDGTVTLPVGDVDIHHCAGESGGVLDYGAAVADTTVNWTDFSGELVIDNLGQNGTDILNIRGHGKIVFNASCVGGTVNWDGHFTITDNGSGITFNSDDISSNVDSLVTSVAGLNDISAAEVNAECDTALSDYGTTAITESYATDGSAATPEQLQYMIWSLLSDFSISGTTYTSKKIDGSTTAMTFTLDDGTTPTAMNRAT